MPRTKLNTLEKLRKHLKPGGVYRRKELAHLSTNLDRHLRQLLQEGTLEKLQHGLYARRRKTAFGAARPEEKTTLKAFLKTDNFLVYSPSQFNALRLGTTQLYNLRVVLNQKRHGRLAVGAREYFFRRWSNVPKKLTKEVLLVELLNDRKRLAEDDAEAAMNLLKKKLLSGTDFNTKALQKAAAQYGTYSTQNTLREWSAPLG